MNKSKARKKQGRVARRPQKSPSPAANDEHTNIIDSLRKELKASKGREKELAEEFTNNFTQGRKLKTVAIFVRCSLFTVYEL